MKTTKRWLGGHLFQVLDVFKALGIAVMLLMFMNFNIKLAQSVQTTKTTAASTNSIVKKQNDILNAIKTLALDSKHTADQKNDIIICMLQVPVSQRTTDTVEGCRKQVDGGTFPGSASNAGTSGNTSSKASNQSGTQTPAASSPQSAPAPHPTQSNNVQPTTPAQVPVPSRPGVIKRIIDFINPFN